jgi:hypothetical protein
MQMFKVTATLCVLLCVQLAIAQDDLSDSIDAPSSSSSLSSSGAAPSDRSDAKASESNGDNLNDDEKPKADKPRKTTFKEERFEKLFSTRNRKPRLPPPKYNLKPKPTLPSFFKSAPNVKPASESDEPIARPSPTVKPKKTSNGRLATTSTTTVSPRSRARTSSSSSSPKPNDHHSNNTPKSGHNEASELSRKRFTSGRGRGTPSRTRPTSGTA